MLSGFPRLLRLKAPHPSPLPVGEGEYGQTLFVPVFLWSCTKLVSLRQRRGQGPVKTTLTPALLQG
jgi:hypothetical protein